MYRSSRILPEIFLLGVFAASAVGCGLKIATLKNAQLTGEIECDESATPFGGGSGSAAAPYALCSPTHVQNIANALAASYVVAKDVDFTGVSSWTPIGDDTSPFTGTLNGNGKKFSHLTISLAGASNTAWVGIFQTIGTGATVEDLTLENIAVAGNNRTGVLAGHVVGSTVKNLTLKNDSVTTRGSGGGVAGQAETGTTTSGIVIDQISISSSADGSLVGSTYDTGVGSVYGRASGTETLANATITNATIAWSPTGTNIAGWTHVGGVIGYLGGTEIDDTTFQGTVTAGATYVGGVAGQWDGNGLNAPGGMSRVHVYGTTVSSTGRSGGLVGMLNRRTRVGGVPAVLDASFQGTVHGDVYAGGFASAAYFGAVERLSIKADVSGKKYVGGIYGYLIYGVDLNGTKDVTFSGTVAGQDPATSDYLGLFAGTTSAGTAEVVNNVYLSGTITNANSAAVNVHSDFGNLNAGSTTSGIYQRDSLVTSFTPIRATGLSDAQAVDASQFAGFDFTNTWVMPLNSAYAGLASPVLRMMCGRDGIICP